MRGKGERRLGFLHVEIGSRCKPGAGEVAEQSIAPTILAGPEFSSALTHPSGCSELRLQLQGS